MDFPIGLSLIFLTLLAAAVLNFLTKEVATVGGLAFTGVFLTIFSVSAAIIILPSFSVTSPVTSTVWLTCGIIFALLSAARPPPS